MTSYVDVFGGDTVPPSDNRYVAVALTANTTFYWSELASGPDLMADIMEVTPDAAWDMTFPDATVVSTGRDVLVRNLGSDTITLKDSVGGTIGTVAAGVAKYIYLTSNTTAAGTWTIFTFGTGTSAADAATLAGYGLVATGSTLSENFAVVNSSITVTLDVTDRAKTRIFSSSGAVTCNLPSATTAGDGFFTIISNQGSGSVTIDPSSTEVIDGASAKSLAPLESAIVVSDGTNWVTIGYGRSTQFQFTKLVFPISAGTPFTLTSTQAANKLIEFTGVLTASAIVNVPAIVAIYYVECSYTGAYSVTVKTAAGTGIDLSAGDRSILYCDGVNVTSAQTASVAVSNISGGVAGSVVYQTAPGLTGFSAAGAAGQILVSGGTGAPVFGGAATAPAGLTVLGAAFTSRGITDNAIATALTLSGSGAYSVIIANSGTDPSIGVNGGNLTLVSTLGYPHVKVTTSLNNPSSYLTLSGGYATSSVGIGGTDANANLNISAKGTGYICLRTSSYEQARISNTTSADRYITLTGGNSATSGIATISTGGTAGGNLFISSATGNVAIGGTAYATSGLVIGSTGQANHVVITDSATAPQISTNAGGLHIAPFSARLGINIAPLTNVGVYSNFTASAYAGTEFGAFSQVALAAARGAQVTIGHQTDVSIQTGYSGTAGYATTGVAGSINVLNSGLTIPGMVGVHGYLSTGTGVTSTVTLMQGVKATLSKLDAGATIGTAYAYFVDDVPTCSANAYGYYGNVSSGAGRYSIYMAGTALSYFGGDIQTLGTMYVPGAATPIFRTSSAITSGAGASAGTLTNAPTVGNPTKWIPINDNGTTRYIPAW